MELPISHKIVSQLTRVEYLLATLPRGIDFDSFLKKQSKDNQTTDVLTLAATTDYTIDEATAHMLLESKTGFPTQQNLRFLFNCITVLHSARNLRENAFNSALLQQYNKLISDGFTDFWEEGKVRAAHETPATTYDSLRNKPPHFEYQMWIEVRQALSYSESIIHPLLSAASTLYHLIYSYPFLQFNLQTALLSANANVRPSRYYASGTVSTIKAAWNTLHRTDFIFSPAPHHFTQFSERFIDEYLTQLESIHDTLTHRTSLPSHIRTSLNDRQLKILSYFKQYKKITRKKYAKTMKVAIATAFRDLNDLASKGLIATVGKGRATSYILPNQTEAEPRQETTTQREVVATVIDD